MERRGDCNLEGVDTPIGRIYQTGKTEARKGGFKVGYYQWNILYWGGRIAVIIVIIIRTTLLIIDIVVIISI